MRFKLKHLVPAIGLATSLLMTTLSAQASVIVHNSLASFQAALPSHGTDTLDSLSAGQLAGPITGSAGAFGYRARVVDTLGEGVANGGEDLYALADGAGGGWLGAAIAGNEIVFDQLGANVRGIGGSFFGTDVNGSFVGGRSFTLTLTDLNGNTVQNLLNVASTTGFIGFVSTAAISSLSLVAVQGNGFDPFNPATFNYATVNDLVIGGVSSAVPEPSSTLGLALMAIGLAGLASQRRQRRR